jgi:hypothetical protein
MDFARLRLAARNLPSLPVLGHRAAVLDDAIPVASSRAAQRRAGCRAGTRRTRGARRARGSRRRGRAGAPRRGTRRSDRRARAARRASATPAHRPSSQSFGFTARTV